MHDPDLHLLPVRLMWSGCLLTAVLGSWTEAERTQAEIQMTAWKVVEDFGWHQKRKQTTVLGLRTMCKRLVGRSSVAVRHSTEKDWRTGVADGIETREYKYVYNRMHQLSLRNDLHGYWMHP